MILESAILQIRSGQKPRGTGRGGRMRTKLSSLSEYSLTYVNLLMIAIPRLDRSVVLVARLRTFSEGSCGSTGANSVFLGKGVYYRHPGWRVMISISGDHGQVIDQRGSRDLLVDRVLGMRHPEFAPYLGNL